MKRTLRFFLVTAVSVLFCLPLAAQQKKNDRNAWQEKMQAEKIAFLTAEMDLTPQEAQAFWPVYNQSEKERFKATEAVFKAFGELDKALRDGKTEKEISNLLQAYSRASKQAAEMDSNYIEKYLNILSSEKVARLVTGEEKFRQFQIHKLRPGSNNDMRAPKQ